MKHRLQQGAITPALTLLGVLWLGMGCNSSSSPNRADSAGTAAAEAIKQPIEQTRDAEKQIFDSAERQKQQADAL